MTTTFSGLAPLTDSQMASQHANAVWSDVRSTFYGPAPLRKHQSKHDGRPTYLFPYADRAYLLHRDTGAATWAVTLYAAPSASDPAGTVTQVGTIVTGKRTQRDAVTQVVRDLYRTRDDHGYRRGSDSCPSCDHFSDEVYPDLP